VNAVNYPPFKDPVGKLDALSATQAGKVRRLRRLLSPVSNRTVIVPVDDSLIFGPAGGLEQMDSKIERILADPPEAILAFPGLFRSRVDMLSRVGGIVNLTASTTRSAHTRKVQVGTVYQAAQLGLDAVAVHVNLTSSYEFELLKILGIVSQECESYGMPLLAIMYPRAEGVGGDNNYDELQRTDRKSYAQLVAHSARVGADLGATLIKTKYTGDPESFRFVVEACNPVPVVVAGGPALPPFAMLKMAYEVISAGGAGVSFGRNVFSRLDPQPYVVALKSIVHKGVTAEEAFESGDFRSSV
jgi:fructose-bisphosphate aldolase/2-amino-3,7-dideoxy-D-threo-hept-6-ulosonate synthase